VIPEGCTTLRFEGAYPRSPNLGAEIGAEGEKEAERIPRARPYHRIQAFMDESWVEHLRQHERAPAADRDILNKAKKFLVEGESTKSTHWLGDQPAPPA